MAMVTGHGRLGYPYETVAEACHSLQVLRRRAGSWPVRVGLAAMGVGLAASWINLALTHQRQVSTVVVTALMMPFLVVLVARWWGFGMVRVPPLAADLEACHRLARRAAVRFGWVLAGGGVFGIGYSLLAVLSLHATIAQVAIAYTATSSVLLAALGAWVVRKPDAALRSGWL